MRQSKRTESFPLLNKKYHRYKMTESLIIPVPTSFEKLSQTAPNLGDIVRLSEYSTIFVFHKSSTAKTYSEALTTSLRGTGYKVSTSLNCEFLKNYKDATDFTVFSVPTKTVSVITYATLLTTLLQIHSHLAWIKKHDIEVAIAERVVLMDVPTFTIEIGMIIKIWTIMLETGITMPILTLHSNGVQITDKPYARMLESRLITANAAYNLSTIPPLDQRGCNISIHIATTDVNYQTCMQSAKAAIGEDTATVLIGPKKDLTLHCKQHLIQDVMSTQISGTLIRIVPFEYVGNGIICRMTASSLYSLISTFVLPAGKKIDIYIHGCYTVNLSTPPEFSLNENFERLWEKCSPYQMSGFVLRLLDSSIQPYDVFGVAHADRIANISELEREEKIQTTIVNGRTVVINMSIQNVLLARLNMSTIASKLVEGWTFPNKVSIYVLAILIDIRIRGNSLITRINDVSLVDDYKSLLEFELSIISENINSKSTTVHINGVDIDQDVYAMIVTTIRELAARLNYEIIEFDVTEMIRRIYGYMPVYNVCDRSQGHFTTYANEKGKKVELAQVAPFPHSTKIIVFHTNFVDNSKKVSIILTNSYHEVAVYIA